MADSASAGGRREPPSRSVAAAQAASKQVSSGWRRPFVLPAMMSGLIVAVLDNSLVIPALPALQHALEATAGDVRWILDAYTLTFASLMLMWGFLSDAAGCKRVFVAGLSLLAAGSLAGGLSGSAGQLIASRAVQGLGAAAVLPGSLCILTATFAGAGRGAAVGIWAAVSGAGVVAGPALGGYMAQNYGWQSSFFISAAAAIAGVMLTGIFVRHTRGTTGLGHLDLAGLITGTAALLFLVYGLTQGRVTGWTDPLTLGAFTAAAVLLMVFLSAEARSRSPVLPLRLLRDSTFAGSNVVAALLFAALFGTALFLVAYLQTVRRYSPVQTGLLLAPLAGAILLVSPPAGRLSNRHGRREFMAAGSAVAGIGVALLVRIQPDSTYAAVILPPLIVLGVGTAMMLPAMTLAATDAAELPRAGIAAGAAGTARGLGGVLGMTAMGTVLARGFKDRLLESLTSGGIRGSTARMVVDAAASDTVAARGSWAALRQQLASGTPAADTLQVVGAARQSLVSAVQSGMLLVIAFMVVASLTAAIFIRRHVPATEPLGGPASRQPEVPLPEVPLRTVADQAPISAALHESDVPHRRPPAENSALEKLRAQLESLPFRAGTLQVRRNLAELSHDTLEYYRYGLSPEAAGQRLPLGVSSGSEQTAGDDVRVVAGYLSLEQRLGRISPAVSPQQAAAMLIGALASRALDPGSQSRHERHEPPQHGNPASDDEFVERIVSELLQETGHQDAAD